MNTPLNNIKVLLAEDNEVNKLLALSILRHWGVETKTAHNGTEVISLVQQEHFDVILMDIQMPEKSGIEATQAIRALADETKKNIPIIALTANALRGEEKKYIAVGMNDYLTKPFTENELYKVIQRVLSDNNSFGSRYESDAVENLNLPLPTEILYDMTLVNDLAQNNADFVKSLVQIFINTIPTTSKEMVDNCTQKNWEQTGKLAHKLKSTIDTMQILSIKEDVRTIEMNCKNNQQLEHIPYLVKRVDAVIERATEQLKNQFAL